MRTTTLLLTAPVAALAIGATALAGAQAASAGAQSPERPGYGVTAPATSDQVRDRLRDGTCDPAATQDQLMTQTRDRLWDASCAATCDGDQLRTHRQDQTLTGDRTQLRDRTHQVG